ncbi:hypothetical protein AXX17_AT1G60700 [Arabidopsis thaliana]|jgi:hypothetical protein|uniref:non-specific serine/threonine protein kinase n=1 Tax=Arabidopsis thaliana TaxID=3702 RepID=A0A178WFL4_ARATH|nr:hypothetical protein AXX17_AT1G60700 [Arabidopsis thaliana]
MSYSFIWMLFVIHISCVLSATELELHRRCNGTFSCGDQRELFYPFWTSGREDCGHPDFKLDDCSGRFAELSISSVKFRILASVYGSNIIRLGRSEYIGDLCPQDPINAPFSESVLPFAPNTELLTIFYNCSRDFPQQVTNFGDFACGDDSDDDRSYYVTRNLSFPPLSEINDLLYDFSQSCDRNVSIPASGSTLNILQSTPSNDNLKKALEYGFELELNQDCRTCIDSKGACGYSQTSSRFVCYSIEEPQTPTPPNPTRNKGNISYMF